jgi:hypothetical protein
MRTPRRRAIWTMLVLGPVASLLLVLAKPAGAIAPAAPAIHHRILGKLAVRPARLPLATAGRLIYHGGSVMRTNKTFAIYWVPAGWSMVSGYRTTINRYLHDSAADSGGTQNVYSTQVQYSDTTGPIAYSQKFGGSTTSKVAFPSNGCSIYMGLRACLTDAQVATQIRAVIAAKGWTAGPTHAFFLFLPKNVGVCDDATGSACAFNSYCAYHSWIGSGPTEVVYADMPYSDTAPDSCATGRRPNGNDADDTLNVASHEHREMIEDPSGNGWYDSAGNEGADKCAWKFGAPLGSTSTGNYNQTINHHYYFVQEEWTNARSTCVQRGT